ncbi:MAG: hypothetical protein PUB10_02415 [Clostridiales bacterium]|nr:hypothetical protein [Clostridiales bacterium]
MECRRVFCRKKMVMFIGLLILANAFLFLKETVMDDKKLGIDRLAQNRYEQEFLKQYKGMTPEQVNVEMEKEAALEGNTWMPEKLMAFYELKDQAVYLAGYRDSVEQIQKRQQSMSSLCVFNRSRFSMSNVIKTAKDYGKVKDTVLSMGADGIVDRIAGQVSCQILVCVFLLFLVFDFQQEVVNGFSYVVYATPEGRGKLSFRRIVLLVLSGLLVGSMLYAERIFLNLFFFGGADSLSRTVQSVASLSGICIPGMTVGGYLVFYSIVHCLGAVASVMAIWFFFALFRNHTAAMLASGIVYAVEYSLWRFITPQSRLVLLHDLNLWNMLEPFRWMAEYRNVNVFGRAVGLFSMESMFLVMLLISVGTGICICGQKKRPVGRSGRLAAIADNMKKKAGTFLCGVPQYLNSTGVELYKLLIPQKGFLVLILAGYLCSGFFSTDRMIQYSSVESILNEVYDTYGGTLPEDQDTGIYEYVKQSSETVQDARNYYMDYKKKYKEGICSQEELEEAGYRVDACADLEEAVRILKKHISYLEGQKRMGKNVELINPSGYYHLLDKDDQDILNVRMLELLFMITVLSTGVMLYEKKCKTLNLFRSTEKGRGRIFASKCVAVSVVSGGMCLLEAASHFYYVSQVYGITGLGAAVQSLEEYGNVQVDVSIGFYLAVLLFVRLLLFVCVSVSVVCLSVFLPQKNALPVSLLLVCIPGALYITGIELFRTVSLTVPCGAVGLHLFEAESYGWIKAVLVMSAASVLLGITGYRISKNGKKP